MQPPRYKSAYLTNDCLETLIDQYLFEKQFAPSEYFLPKKTIHKLVTYKPNEIEEGWDITNDTQEQIYYILVTIATGE